MLINKFSCNPIAGNRFNDLDSVITENGAGSDL